MNTANTAIVPGADWHPLRAQLRGTVLVIGKPGLGKTSLVRYLAEQLTTEGCRVGVLSTDMGQASVGVPTCLGLSLTPPWQEAAASWFIGDTTPVGNLLPTVVGAAQLTRRAHQQQVQTLLVDTTGLVDGPLACVLKYHKSVAIGVDHVVALQRDSELEMLLAVLQPTCRAVHCVHPTAAARDRSPGERKQYRETQFLAHFQGGVIVEFDLGRLLNPDWTLGLGPQRAVPRPGTVVGLINQDGFCLGLGLLEEIGPDRTLVFTNWRNRDAVTWVQVGKVRLTQHGEEISR
jgi:polynucleotide 5'-hydroxyl-kinase GRC3/NOL9